MTRASAKDETLEIPQRLREQVDERDGQHCRVCGRYLADERALHHIHYGGDQQGMGGRRSHSLDNLVTVCWMWGRNCHSLVHSDKRIYVPLLEQVINTPGVTVLQLQRWNRQPIRSAL